MAQPRPPVFKQVHPVKESESPDWTKEGPLDIDDSLWVLIAARILMLPEVNKVWFGNKKG
jgi:hypothetical protein